MVFYIIIIFRNIKDEKTFKMNAFNEQEVSLSRFNIRKTKILDDEYSIKG